MPAGIGAPLAAPAFGMKTMRQRSTVAGHRPRASTTRKSPTKRSSNATGRRKQAPVRQPSGPGALPHWPRKARQSEARVSAPTRRASEAGAIQGA